MRSIRTPGLALSSLLLVTAVAGAQPLHFEDTIIQAEKNNQKHVKAITQTLVMPFDAPDGGMVCGSYGNTLSNGNRGSVEVDVEIQRADGSVETKKFSEKVSKNAMSECRDTGALEIGDLMIFDFVFKNLPKLKLNDSRQDFVEISGAFTTLDRPGLPGTGAGGSGVLSDADQAAVVTLRNWAKGSRGAALRFESKGVIVDWRLTPSGSEKLPGFHSSISKAVAAFCNIVKNC